MSGEPPAIQRTTAHDAVSVAWRDHWGRLLSLLVSRYRRLDLAEDALADAFEAAARRWPADGVPDNPPAWLLTTARRRVLDRLRAESIRAVKAPLLIVDQQVAQAEHGVLVDIGDGSVIPDERLRLVLLCAHPALSAAASSALALRLVIGLDVDDIARLFLDKPATVAARITRAKHKIVSAGMPFVRPSGTALQARLGRVAQVAYLAFTAGYVPGPGADLHRAELAGEALRMARITRDLAGPHPLLDTLLALMMLQHSRRDSRLDDDGDLVLLPDQDRRRWRHDEIAAALGLLTEQVRVPSEEPLARQHLLEALIAAEHAMAARAQDTRWDRIVGRYAELEALTGSPVVRLNRAVAVAELSGPAAGLALLDGLDQALPDTHRLPSVRAELLARQGQVEPARAAYLTALERCRNEVEHRHLQHRLAALDDPPGQ